MEEPHATAIRKFTEWAGEGSAFVEWTSPNNTIDWPEAMKKLERPTYYYKKQEIVAMGIKLIPIIEFHSSLRKMQKYILLISFSSNELINDIRVNPTDPSGQPRTDGT